MRKTQFQRIFSFLLATAIVFALCPAVTAEDTTPYDICPLCNTAVTKLTYNDWDKNTVFADNTLAGDNHYRLSTNVKLAAQLVIPEGACLVLDLNGYTMTAAEAARCFSVVGGTLILLDSSAKGTGTLVGSDVSVYGRCEDGYGGTIYVMEGGTFNMLSGTVTGGSAVYGGNICGTDATLNICGGTVSEGTAVAVEMEGTNNTGRGGNLYLSYTTTLICGDAKILDGTAQYLTRNSGRGGNLFVIGRGETVISGNAVVAGGYAASRGGNMSINTSATVTICENAEVYGGVAKSVGNNIDVMTATLTVAGGTVYGSPVGGAANNITFYSSSSGLNITGGRIYGRIVTLAEMAINISGAPYVEHLYLPEKAYVNPEGLADGAWIGVEAEKYQYITGALEDPSCYVYFFNYDKTGLTWYDRRGGTNAIYLTTGTGCQCCGEDVTDIQWLYLTADTVIAPVEGNRIATHYRLAENIQLTDAPITVDGTQGAVTLDLCGYTLTAPENQQALNILAGSTLNIVDNSSGKKGTLLGGGDSAATGGVLKIIGQNTVVNLYSGTITGGSTVGDNFYGGGIYLTDYATLNMYGGNIVNNTAEDHGGNMFVSGMSTFNLYGGLISGGTALGGTNESGATFTGNGGNIYITGRSLMNMYGGLITDGKNMKGAGGNIFVNSGAAFRMYDGTVENGAAARTAANLYVNSSSGGVYSSIEIYGGTVGLVDTSLAKVKSIAVGSSENPFYIYNGVILGQDVQSHLAPCACYSYDGTDSTVWNYGHSSDVCDYSCAMEQAWGKAYVKDIHSGQHQFQLEKGTATCSLCSYTYYGKNIVAMAEGRVFEDLEEALSITTAGSTVVLLANVSVAELVVTEKTLDLNGYTLTAPVFTSALSGNVIDSSKKTTGKLVTENAIFADTNTYLPLTLSDGIHFCEVGFEQWLERVDEETTKVKFHFEQKTVDTIIDNALRDGNTEMEVQIRLTWTDSNGISRDKIYVFGPELLQKYLEKWNSRVFVTTIKGGTNVTDLKCTYQIASSAASGTTVRATTLNNVAEIQQKLTWDAINSFPIKHSSMTVDEMRDLVISFMKFNKTYLWTPDQSVSFDKNAGGTDDVMLQGNIYGGLPYVGVATGNVYRMMDYINPETGLLDMEKALPALATKDHLTMSDLKYFGSQCSINVYWGWGRVMNSTAYQWTSSVVPRNGFIFLGDIKIDDVSAWSASYNTDMACAANGQQVMYAGYAQALRADGLVYYVETSGGNGAGHLVMVYEDAHVVYNRDGSINGTESYLTIIDQAQTWETDENEAGDTFLRKDSVGKQVTFKKLYDTGYIPFTFPEFVSGDPIEETEVSLVSGETTYVSGVINEDTGVYEGTQNVQTLTWQELFSSKITSNYGIADAYIIVYNSLGQEIYRHAVRVQSAGRLNLSLVEEGAQVTTWSYANMAKGQTYDMKIEVQLATGERPVIFNGQLTMAN